MSESKIFITAVLLLISITAFSQIKKQDVIAPSDTKPVTTLPPVIGYPATRNGKAVWVMKPRPVKFADTTKAKKIKL